MSIEIKKGLKIKQLWFTLLTIMLIIFTTVTFIDIYSDNELSSSSSYIYDKDVQFEYRKKEFILRDTLSTICSKELKRIKSHIIDTTKINKSDRVNIVKYYFLNNLNNGKKNSVTIIPLNKTSSLSPIVILESIQLKLTVNIDKIKDVLNKSENLISYEDLLKYGNIIDSEFIFIKKLDKKTIAISLFIIAALSALFVFSDKIGGANFEINSFLRKYDKNKSELDDVKATLDEEENISIEDKNKINEIIVRIENEIIELKSIDILQSIQYDETVKSEKKSSEIYSRSTLMLVLGLLIAVIGVVVFYFTIPQYSNDVDFKKYFALALRPTLILIFIQSISFYLLRQYRMLIQDFKYFNNLQSNKTKSLIIQQLLSTGTLTEPQSKYVDFLISELNNNKLDEGIKKEEDEKKSADFNNKTIIESISALINKLK